MKHHRLAMLLVFTNATCVACMPTAGEQRDQPIPQAVAPAVGGTEASIAALLERLHVLRDSALVEVRYAAALGVSDSVAMDRRQHLANFVREGIRELNDSSVQLLVWPDGWRGMRLKRHLRATGGTTVDSVENVTRSDSLVAALKAGGVWVSRAEGGAYLEVRESWLSEVFAPHLSQGMREFWLLAAEEQEEPAAEDASIQISLSELEERLRRADQLFGTGSNAAYRSEIQRARDRYLALLMRGTDNSPAFDRWTLAMSPDVRQSLQRIAARGLAGAAQGRLEQYLKLLRENGFRRTPAVNAYLREMHQ